MANPVERQKLTMDYFAVKTLHQSAVTLSLLGFVARGLGALNGAAWVRHRAARTLPHVVDTVLLGSALWLAFTLQLNPLHTPWLAAKIVALLAYIALGMVALKPGRPLRLRATAWVAALGCFGYIVSVALTKQVAGFFTWL